MGLGPLCQEFRAQTIFTYQLPPVDLAIYNAVGQRVIRLVRGVREAGYHKVPWKCKDESGRSVGSGVYMCRLRAGSFEQTRRLVLLK